MSQFPPTLWDEEHVKALLGLRRYPARLIRSEPWRSWLVENGGEKQVIERLRSIAITPSQKQLLEVLLAHPEAPTLLYASKLHVSHSRYFVHLNGLIKLLIAELNDWDAQTPTNASTSSPVPAIHRPAFGAGPAQAPHRLPAPLTSLVGAEESVATVVEILKRPNIRLLTLTGLGGVGKTRLALTAGRRLVDDFRDGVFFIPLEALNDPAFLVNQITHFLNIETDGAQSLIDTLKTCLRDRQILLILDNFEQLITGGAFVVELLEAAPGLKILVTSREVLNIYGENRFDVPELPRPDPDHLPPLEQLNIWPAIDLFVQRVQARYPAFALTETNKDAVAGICNRLDGIPLAIELAAAQVKLLPHTQALPHLEHGLKSLRDAAHNRPKHQKTLWDAFDWSYRLLSTAEQTLFRRLAVFGREWNVIAAQTVCDMEEIENHMEKLADKSLVRFTSIGVDGELRYQMLQAVREYALDRLSANGETEETHYRHAQYYLDMVLEAEPHVGMPGQMLWMRRLEQERENLRTALQWMLNQNKTEMAFHFLGAAWRYYSMLNIWDETEAWMKRTLEQGKHLKTPARAKTLWGMYWLISRQNDHTRSWALAEEGLRLARDLEDERLIGVLLQCMAAEFRYQSRFEEALQAVEESLQIFRKLEDQQEIAWTLSHRSALLLQRGEFAKSQQVLEESLSLFRAIGNDWAVEHVLRDLAILLLQQGKLEQVKTVLEESLKLSEKLGKRMGTGWALNLQGQLAMRRSDLAAARSLFEKAQAVFEALGDQHSLSFNRGWIEQLQESRE